MQTWFLFSQRPEILKVSEDLTFLLHKVHPHFPSVVINKGIIILASMHRRSLCWPPYIIMYHLKWPLTYVLLMWKNILCLLPKLACFTYLVHTIHFKFFPPTSPYAGEMMRETVRPLFSPRHPLRRRTHESRRVFGDSWLWLRTCVVFHPPTHTHNAGSPRNNTKGTRCVTHLLIMIDVVAIQGASYP